MSHPRPPIPEELKRQVRRRCHFGCVMCGLPLYHIDHIVDYKDVRKHELDNLTLLCATHHDLKTRGALSAERVKQATERVQQDRSRDFKPLELDFSSSSIEVAVGGIFTRCFDLNNSIHILRINDAVHFSVRFEECFPLLSLVQHWPDSTKAFEISDNELLIINPGWDVELRKQEGVFTLTVKAGPQAVAFEIKFFPPTRIEIFYGLFIGDGIGVLIQNGATICLNTRRWVKDCEGYFSNTILIARHPDRAISCGAVYSFTVPYDKPLKSFESDETGGGA